MSNSPAQKVNVGLIDVVIGQRVFEVSFNTKTVSGKYLTEDRRENLITASWDSPVLRIRALP